MATKFRAVKMDEKEIVAYGPKRKLWMAKWEGKPNPKTFQFSLKSVEWNGQKEWCISSSLHPSIQSP
jgi:hypothetical protein